MRDKIKNSNMKNKSPYVQFLNCTRKNNRGITLVTLIITIIILLILIGVTLDITTDRKLFNTAKEQTNEIKNKADITQNKIVGLKNEIAEIEEEQKFYEEIRSIKSANRGIWNNSLRYNIRSSWCGKPI